MGEKEIETAQVRSDILQMQRQEKRTAKNIWQFVFLMKNKSADVH